MLKLMPEVLRAPEDVPGGAEPAVAEQQPPAADAPPPAQAPDVAGLLKKQSDLLSETKAAKAAAREAEKRHAELLERLGGEDAVEQFLAFQKRAAESEELSLVKDGKLNELRDRWLSAAKRDHEKAVKGLQATLQEASGKVTELQSRLHKEIIGNAVRSAANGIKEFASSAVEDAVFIATTRVFSLDEETGEVIGRDETGAELFGKDGKRMTVNEWLEGQADQRPHWFYADGGTGMRRSAGPLGSITLDRQAVRNNIQAYRQAKKLAADTGKPVSFTGT